MINRAKMPRQLRNKGGITSVVPREQYGLGSKIKDRIRKLIPNELASVAVKAAPIVAPFNPAVAGLMRGIGRFDQRGSISDALKQGVGTFAFGKAVGKQVGQKVIQVLGSQRFNMEGFKQGPIGSLFNKQAVKDSKVFGKTGDKPSNYYKKQETLVTKSIKRITKWYCKTVDSRWYYSRCLFISKLFSRRV